MPAFSWRELQYGLLNDLIGAHALIECAVNEAGSTDQPSPEVLELAGSDASDPVAERVARLAASEPAVSEDDVRGKWLYLILAWLYARRDALPEPLQVVEEVYADFGYPEEMATFIRYIPMEGPSSAHARRTKAA